MVAAPQPSHSVNTELVRRKWEWKNSRCCNSAPPHPVCPTGVTVQEAWRKLASMCNSLTDINRIKNISYVQWPQFLIYRNEVYWFVFRYLYMYKKNYNPVCVMFLLLLSISSENTLMIIQYCNAKKNLECSCSTMSSSEALSTWQFPVWNRVITPRKHVKRLN